MAFANLVVEVGLNGSAFERGVTNVIAKAQQMNAAFGKAVTGIAKNQISQAFAVAAVVNKMQAGISEAIAFGSSISDLSTQLNVSTDALQLWNYAATQNGATLGDVSAMFTKLAINSQVAVNGNLEMVAAFAKLGVTIDDVKNKKPEDIARQIGKAFEKGANPNALVGSLRAVGGRGADALISAFEKGIGATFDEGLQLNIIINADELAKIDALGDRLDVIQMQMRPVFFGIAIVLAQVAEAIYDSVRLLTAGVMDLKNNFNDPIGAKNIKDPELRERVIEQNKKDQAKRNIDPENKYKLFGGGIVSAEETIQGMRSAKLGEIDQLLKKKNNLEVGELKSKTARLQAELKALTKAYVEPFSAVSTLVQEKIDQINAEGKALDEAARKKLQEKRNKPLVDESIPKKLRPVAREKQVELLPKITDSLAKFGGFTLGRDVLTLTVAKQQLAVLETISKNTDALKDFEPAGDGL